MASAFLIIFAPACESCLSGHDSTIVLANGLLQGARPEGERASAPFAALLTDLDRVAVPVTQLKQCRFERGSGQSCRRQVGDLVSRIGGEHPGGVDRGGSRPFSAASPLRYHRANRVAIRAST